MNTLAQDAAALDRMAKFPKGKPADPTKNMSPEDKAKWEAMNAEYGDKFKRANGDMIDYFSKHPEKLKERQMRDKAAGSIKGPGIPDGTGPRGGTSECSFTEEIRAAGLIKGPGIPDGTGPRGGTSDCSFTELAALDMDLTSEGLPGAGLDRDLTALEELGRVAAIDVAANSQIGKTIIEQMGGNRAMRMIGAKQIIWLKDGVGVRWPNKQRSKGNYFEVHLTAMDLYNLEFYNVSIRGKKLVKRHRGVMFDQLTELFEQQTGWYLRMASDQLVVAKGDEKDSKFEEGESADPTEKMNEEDAKKWRLENLKNKDKFTDKGKDDKKATFDEGTSRAPDGWDPGHIEDDPGATESTEGSETPDGDGNVEKRAAVQNVNVGPKGMFSYKWPGTFSHGVASRLLRGAISFDRPTPTKPIAFRATVTGGEGSEVGIVRFNPNFNGGPVGVLTLKGDARPEMEAKNMVGIGTNRNAGAAVRKGLYGFTKRVQADCESCVRKVQKSASAIAKRAYGRNAKVAQFLSSHADRAGSLPAKILIAALSEMGPKVAQDMKRQARLEELRAKRATKGKCEICGEILNADDRRWGGKNTKKCRECLAEGKGWDGNDKTATAPRGKVQTAIMSVVSKWESEGYTGGKDLSDMARGAAFRGVHFAKIMSAAEALDKKGMIKFDGVKVTKTASSFPAELYLYEDNLKKVLRSYPNWVESSAIEFAKQPHIQWLGQDLNSAADGIYMDLTAVVNMMGRDKKNMALEYAVPKARQILRMAMKAASNLKDACTDLLWQTESNPEAALKPVLKHLRIYRKLMGPFYKATGVSSKFASKTAARKYGLYGCSDKVANIGLRACSDVRADAGRIAYDLHRRRAAKHARITAFFDQHNKTANCRYSSLLHSSYPSADTKVAAVSPPGNKVADWLTWEE